MNYLKNYNDYVEHVKKEMIAGRRPKSYADKKNFSDYFEMHHIIPRCLGGNDEEENIVALTAREHFLAHYLLMKIYPDNYKLGLAFATFCMNKNNTSKAVIYFNSRLYEICKKNIDFGATSRGIKRQKEFGEKVSKGIREYFKNETEQHKIERCRSIKENHGDISGEKNGMFGKKHTEESKKKMSENTKLAFKKNPELAKNQSKYAKEHFKGAGNPRAKKVKCIETGQVFDTIKEATIWAHNSPKSKCMISECCKGKRTTAFGYHWKYEDNNTSNEN